MMKESVERRWKKLPSKKSVKAVAAGSSHPRPEVHPRVAFIRSVRFSGLGLDRCDAKVDRASLGVVREENSELEHLVNLRQHVLVHEDNYFVVSFDLELIQRLVNSDVKIVTINASFSGRFDLAAKASEEYVRAFANLEARLIFFPYVRHFVSDLTYRMSIDPIVLPMTSELETQRPA
jgi:hypothetical protein